jgi:hypothetical protein
LELVIAIVMSEQVRIGSRVQVRVQVSRGNFSGMNLRWYNFRITPKIDVDQLVLGVYFVANG